MIMIMYNPNQLKLLSQAREGAPTQSLTISANSHSLRWTIMITMMMSTKTSWFDVDIHKVGALFKKYQLDFELYGYDPEPYFDIAIVETETEADPWNFLQWDKTWADWVLAME